MANAFDISSPAFRRDALAGFKIGIPFFSVIGIGIYFNKFVAHAVHAEPIINCAIIGTMCIGILLIYLRFFSLMQDFRVMERFGREASEGAYMSELLEQPWLQKRYVRHYLSHIAQTGGALSSQLDQNAIESELHALAVDYESRMEMPQFLVGFMVAMGLLGTFIGLLETLTGISGMLDGLGGAGADLEAQFTKLVGELRKPLAGMGIAFSASMLGLVGSLVLALSMINLRRYVSRVVSLARNTMHDLIELTRPVSTGSQALTQLSPDDMTSMSLGFGGGGGGGGGAGAGSGVSLTPGEMLEAMESSGADTAGLQDVFYRSQDASILVANRLDILTKKLEVIFESFEVSINGTKKLNELLGFGPRMKETGEQTLAEIKSMVAGQLENQRLSQRMVDISGEMAGVAGSILESQRTAQRDLTASLKALADRLGKVEDVNIGSARHLFEIKENFGKLSTSLSMVEMISTGVGRQTLLLETLVEESRNSQRRLAAMQQTLRAPGAPATPGPGGTLPPGPGGTTP